MRPGVSLRLQLAVTHAGLVFFVTGLLTGIAVRTSASVSLAAASRHTLVQLSALTNTFAAALQRSGADPAELARQLGEAAGGRVLWLDSRGAVRVDGGGDPNVVGEVLPLPEQLEGSGQRLALVTSAGRWVAFAKAPLGPTAGSLLLVQDLSWLQGELDLMRRRLWLGGALLTLVGLGGGLVLAGHLSRPIAELTVAARRMAAGEFRQRVEVGGAREAGELADAFNAMAERVVLLDQQRRAFLADAAHELRTPLAALHALAESIGRGLTGELPRETVEGIARQTERLGRLVEALLTLARLDNPDLPLNLVPLSAVHLIEEARWVANALASEKGVHLEVAPVDPNLLLFGDPDWLHRALLNVLDNAVRYTPRGGRVTVTAFKASDDLAEIRVADSGPGVPAEFLGRLGERFARLDPSRQRTQGGAGLGLAITREVMRRHGGDVVFESPPGRGLVVRLRLPVAAEGEWQQSEW